MQYRFILGIALSILTQTAWSETSFDSNGFTPLPNQDYALCAGAVTFNFDGITYAKCRKNNGNSLALTHAYPGGNAQTVNAIGTAQNNGSFFLSTYSPPDPAKYALYACKKLGAYAQCNGGICFTDTSGKNFPAIGPVGQNEIICSCPITTSTSYHVTGPMPCAATAKEYDQICGSGSSKIKTADGVSLMIGAGGPPASTLAMNAYYDHLFGTKSPETVCKRP